MERHHGFGATVQELIDSVSARKQAIMDRYLYCFGL